MNSELSLHNRGATGTGEACRRPIGLDGSDRAGGSGGDATATAGGRGGAGARRGSAGTSGCRGRASATTAVVAEENRGAEAAATPLEVSVFSVTFALSLARFMVIS